MSQWIIIYPCGNRSKIGIAEICEGMEYEIEDYALASRRRFYDEREAKEYAVQLARENGLSTDMSGVHDYLD